MTFFYALLLCLHLFAVVFWVGGMATMHFAVRPAALQTLEPPSRLDFMAHALARFFAGVGAAIAVLLVSGATMIALAGGFARLHWSVHFMVAAGLLMVAIFGHIRFSPYRHLRRAINDRDWAKAAASLNAVRGWVAANLLLGSLVIAVTIVGRSL